MHSAGSRTLERDVCGIVKKLLGIWGCIRLKPAKQVHPVRRVLKTQTLGLSPNILRGGMKKMQFAHFFQYSKKKQQKTWKENLPFESF